jgi:hypothetical protein
MSHADQGRARLRAGILLALILATAGFVRCFGLGHSPPGIHIDAASNAWNAWCLLEEGRDWTGRPWPVFYTSGFGANRSTLFLYALMPFQAVWGLSTATTALPSAVGGILTVLLAFVVGARLWGRSVGLAAAALLAVMPWHLYLSRTGHEAGLAPLLFAAPFAAALWAGLPFAGGEARPRPVRAALAGLLASVACYGYPAVRLVLPPFLLLAAMAAWEAWPAFLRERRGKTAAILYPAGLIAGLGPLLWVHATDPAINARARELMLWDGSASVGANLAAVAQRYLLHLDPRFLFIRGDSWFWNGYQGVPPLQLWLLPLLLVGLVSMIGRLGSSRASRTLLALLAAYPLGDVLTRHDGVHALRSSPALLGFALLAGLGLVRVAAWLRERSPRLAPGLLAAGALAVLLLVVPMLRVCLVDYGRRPEAHVRFNQALLDACAWLVPRLEQADAVFFTSNNPGAAADTLSVTLVGLRWDAAAWFEEERLFRRVRGRDYLVRYGKIHLIVGDEGAAALRRFRMDGRENRVFLVLRPEDSRRPEPAHVIRDPVGRAVLLIHEERL